MKFKSYYAVLGVAHDADIEQITKAYRKLARAHHPDMSKASEAGSKFKEAAEAYETLKDPEKRAAYEGLGKAPEGSDFSPPPQWRDQYQRFETAFDQIDLADLLASLGMRSDHIHSTSHPIPFQAATYKTLFKSP